jgi:hypothetical protein
MAQRDRGDWVDNLANAVRADRTFPKNGDPEAVRATCASSRLMVDMFQGGR